ncbi:MAG: hypothetical protein AAF790_12745 [Planctomycetota bacterium]
MIHFTCDCCQRTIDCENEVRYVVRLEVYAAVDAEAGDLGEEVDHLEEIDEVLERIDCPSDGHGDGHNDGPTDQQLDRNVYEQVRYDLCQSCREQFTKNPLGRLTPVKLGFSEN